MTNSLRQLTLALYHNPRADFASYHAGLNAEALAAMVRWADETVPWYVYLWGGPAVGKSHLLQAALRLAGNAERSTMYVPLSEVAAHGPQVLEGLEVIDVLCIDDLDVIAGQREWEIALFAFFNRLHAAGRALAVAARQAPAALPLVLPDLASRLSSGLIYQLRELEDADKQAALQAAATRRGIAMPDAVAAYLMRRLPRDMRALLEALELLDTASLSAGRQLTVPFVRATLKLDDDSDA
jgi:DnaA family protein